MKKIKLNINLKDIETPKVEAGLIFKRKNKNENETYLIVSTQGCSKIVTDTTDSFVMINLKTMNAVGHGDSIKNYFEKDDVIILGKLEL